MASTKTSLAAKNPPRAVIRYQEAGTTWSQITLPAWARRVSISPVGAACHVAIDFNGTLADGDAFSVNVDDYKTVASGSEYTAALTAGRGNNLQCTVLIHTAGATYIEAAAEEFPGG